MYYKLCSHTKEKENLGNKEEVEEREREKGSYLGKARQGKARQGKARQYHIERAVRL